MMKHIMNTLNDMRYQTTWTQQQVMIYTLLKIEEYFCACVALVCIPLFNIVNFSVIFPLFIVSTLLFAVSGAIILYINS